MLKSVTISTNLFHIKLNRVFVSNVFFDQKGQDELYQSYIKRFAADVVKFGLPIGNRWVIRQEGDYLVIRDEIGSKVKDSRYAFAPKTYKNL